MILRHIFTDQEEQQEQENQELVLPSLLRKTRHRSSRLNTRLALSSNLLGLLSLEMSSRLHHWAYSRN
jgi:hypothetical protein